MTKMTPRVPPAHFARLAAGPVALLALGVLAGCGDPADDASGRTSTTPVTATSSTSATTTSPSSSASSSSSSSSSSPAGRTLEITVDGKDVSPAPRTVDLAVGETLTLVVTSDHDDELHVHGFEVEGALVAGKPTSVTLTGKEPGVYEVETHEPPLRLLKIAVR
ncbi:hypothetical protein [Pedococcus aerophilus]|uniref:hypothetical protein n=1 Tax=Pedococcus aerophilus TaxID=436356 RepID=UPI0031D180E5